MFRSFTLVYTGQSQVEVFSLCCLMAETATPHSVTSEKTRPRIISAHHNHPLCLPGGSIIPPLPVYPPGGHIKNTLSLPPDFRRSIFFYRTDNVTSWFLYELIPFAQSSIVLTFTVGCSFISVHGLPALCKKDDSVEVQTAP